MKSRKLGFLGLSKRKTREAKSNKRTVVRLGVLESLEKRELMATDFADSIASRGYFTSQSGQNSVIQYLEAKGTGGSGSGGGTASAEYDGTSISVVEAEPNNGFQSAQLLPIANHSAVVVTGTSTNALDDEYFAVDLTAGDIIDVNVQSSFAALINLPFVSLYNSAKKELVTSQWQPFGQPILPPSSPLTSGLTQANLGDVTLHYVIPTTGRYYLRLSDVASTIGTPTTPPSPVNYSMNLKRFRPSIEAEPAGTKQILYLDFEGGIVNRNIFGLGLPGSARISPTRDFLAGYGLQDSDEAALIDAITRAVKAKFDFIASHTTNPNYGIEIRNSKDSPNVWGEPNVTRVIIGGTFQELVSDPAAASGILGISQSIDPGNFKREETVIVMHDVFLQTFSQVPVNSANTRLNQIAELMSMVISHEAGHSFGAWHQDPNSSINGIMDRFYDPFIDSGVGNDGIYGTADDTPIQFTNDRFDGPGGVFLTGGANDTINWLGWALSVGKAGGTVQGTAFRDVNLSRSLDSVDTRLGSITVYADANNNSVLDSNEFSTLSNADGTYSLLVPTGSTYTIRSVVPTGYRISTPLTNSYSVNVATATAFTGRNFGFELLSPTSTGKKYNDVNGNGLFDQGEAGVGDVVIYYDLDGDGRIDLGEPSIKTKADGTYTLPNIGAGTYTIREVLTAGWVQNFPGSTASFGHTITLTGNVSTDALVLQGLDFGNQLIADFSDAPESYGTASNGFVDGLRLGTAWDSESAPLYSANASGDDLSNTDDEDGVSLSTPLVRGSSTNSFAVTTTNTTSQTAYLNVWLDLNRNGVFETTEKVSNPASFSIASSVAVGTVFARFRYGYDQNIGPTGYANSGEVEDYVFTIGDTSSIAVADTDSVPRNGSKIIDVLANDFAAPGLTLTVISTSGTTSAGGSAVPSANGAGVFYVAPTGFVGKDTFQYTVRNSAGVTGIATVTIDVSLFFQNPVAVDDSYDLPTNSIDFPLNVLANDIEGQNGALTITSVVQPDKGGLVTIATGGKSLRYTPTRNFGGTEFVTYTVSDAAGNTATATVTLHTLEGDRTDDLVQIRLEAVDINTGLPISQVEQGKDFKVKVYVDDLRHDTSNPGSGAGVYAAYFDLLYNLQLVSTKAINDPSSRFNFEVSFLTDYVNFTTGDGSIPGVINEFGATSSSLNMQAPNELPFAELTFTARSPGVVNFMPDPADVFPRSDTLLFDTTDAVPVEKIRYLGTQIEVFGDGVQFPVAIDDSTRVFGTNSSSNPIDVLANDLSGSTGSITIITATQGSRGFTAIDRGVSSLPDDDFITYTPNTNFSGFDQFTYTIQDARGIQSTATVTVHVGTAGSTAPDSNDVVDYELVVTDLNGTPIDTVTQGQQFQLRAFVKDLRTTSPTAGRDTRGIFAAYQDVLYNRNLVSAVTSSTNDPNLGFTVQFGTLYNRVREGDVRTSGLLNEIGAVATFDSPEPNAQLNPLGYLDRRIPLFTVTMTADRVGTAEFFSDPVDIVPLHEVLTFDPASTVTPDKIHFGFDSVQIVSAGGGGNGEKSFHNFSNPLDVNNDGKTSPIDALLIINMLNNGLGGFLFGGSGEGEPSKNYVDVNGDDMLTPIDALRVINYLNSRLGSGEGEGSLAALASVPQIESGASQLVAEGEASSQPSVVANSGSAVYGPQLPVNYYSMLADSLYDIEEHDELESVLDDLASDINSTWIQGLNG